MMRDAIMFAGKITYTAPLLSPNLQLLVEHQPDRRTSRIGGIRLKIFVPFVFWLKNK